MDQPIITKSDVLEFWPQMDKNFKEDELEPYTLRAQQADLKRFLGPALYFDFITNPEATNNVALFQGTTYDFQGNTIFFEGVRPLLVAYTFSRVVSNVDISVGRAAVVQKENEQSIPHPNAIIQTRSREVKSEALRLQEETRQFLDQERSDYPLWNRRTDDSADKDTSFSMTRVPRHPQR